MRVIIRSEETNIDLPLPTGLVLNRFTAGLAARAAAEKGVPITSHQMRALIAALHDCKHRHPGWTLVEAESADGEYVMVKL